MICILKQIKEFPIFMILDEEVHGDTQDFGF